jgi:hypothetical protein
MSLKLGSTVFGSEREMGKISLWGVSWITWFINRIKWAQHAAQTGKVRNTHKISVVKPEGQKKKKNHRNLGVNVMPFSFNTSALCYGSGFFWIVILKIYFCTLYNVTSKRDKTLSDFTIYATLE